MKKIVRIGEFVLWLSILAGVALGGYLWYQNTYIKKDLYTIKFHDINGLAKGAPVRLMGVYIGKIERSYIDNGEVFVEFSKFRDDVDIPQCAVATIQFTGLVGAKSLEIEVMRNKNHCVRGIVGIDPIRISSFVEIMAKSSESIAAGSQNFLNVFGSEAEQIVLFNIHKSNQMVRNATDNVYGLDKQLASARNTAKYTFDSISETLDYNIVTTEQIINSLNTSDYSEDTKSILRIVNNGVKFFYDTLKESRYKKYLDNFILIGGSLKRRTDITSFQFVKDLPINPVLERTIKASEGIAEFCNRIERIYCKFCGFEEHDTFDNILNTTKKLNKTAKKMEEAI